MTILVTGATGKVGRALVRRLEAAKQPLLLATRSGTSDGPHLKAVKFDWFDQNTYEAPFAADASIDKVFLIQPQVWDPLTYIKPFVELGIGKGAKRFVFAGGKVAFVSVEDVAKVACDALTAEKSSNRDILIVGPDLYSFDEVAGLLSDILGRKITHTCVPQEEYEKSLQKYGMEARFAAMLGYIQSKYANGSEAAITKDPEAVTGIHHLVDYLQANKSLWMKT